MRLARKLGYSLLLVLASMGIVASTPKQADAYFYNWYGGYRYPYYYGAGYYPSYGYYSPYYSYGYRGYYGNPYRFWIW